MGGSIGANWEVAERLGWWLMPVYKNWRIQMGKVNIQKEVTRINVISRYSSGVGGSIYASVSTCSVQNCASIKVDIYQYRDAFSLFWFKTIDPRGLWVLPQDWSAPSGSSFFKSCFLFVRQNMHVLLFSVNPFKKGDSQSSSQVGSEYSREWIINVFELYIGIQHDIRHSPNSVPRSHSLMHGQHAEDSNITDPIPVSLCMETCTNVQLDPTSHVPRSQLNCRFFSHLVRKVPSNSPFDAVLHPNQWLIPNSLFCFADIKRAYFSRVL